MTARVQKSRPYFFIYTKVFLTTYGPGPWPCEFCGEPVTDLGSDRGHVHHKDEDPYNNQPNNLAAAHPRCHSAFHTRRRPMSDAARRAFAHRPRSSPSAATRAKISASLQKLSPARREALLAQWQEGLTRKALAAAFGISPETVGHIVKAAGPLPRTRRCRKGHPLVEGNLYVDERTGQRRCAICHRARQAAWDARNRAPRKRKPDRRKRCPNCGHRFLPHRRSQRFCSYPCVWQARRMAGRVCPTCNRTFRPANAASKFCCRDCSDRGRATRTRVRAAAAALSTLGGSRARPA